MNKLFDRKTSCLLISFIYFFFNVYTCFPLYIKDATDRSPDPGVSSDDRVTEGLGTTERATSVLAERTVEETDGVCGNALYKLFELTVRTNVLQGAGDIPTSFLRQPPSQDLSPFKC